MSNILTSALHDGLRRYADFGFFDNEVLRRQEGPSAIATMTPSELKIRLEQVVYIAAIATVRKSGGRALGRLGRDLGLIDSISRQGNDRHREAAVEPLQQDLRAVGESHGVLVGAAFQAGHDDFFDGPDAASLANGLADALQKQVRLCRHAHGQVTGGTGREPHGATGKTLEGELLSFFSRSRRIRFQ